MIYKISSEYYTKINEKMPSNVEFGYLDEKTGEYFYDDVILHYIKFDINITIQETLGKTYDELIAELEPSDNYHCKIYSFMPEEALYDVDFRIPPFGYNYKTGLTIRLQPKRTVVKGEVVKVDYFSDTALTDKILTVEIEYERDQFGFATKRKTTRKWVMNNGEYHPEAKITEKYYTVNPEDQIKEGLRRRQNIIDRMQPVVLSLMLEVLAPEGYDSNQVIFIARDFLDRYEPEFERFIKSSSTIIDPDDPNFGKKELAVAFSTAKDSWLDKKPTTLNGLSIRDYIINEVSI